ncbi:MAG: MBL fold metallo-hydrolase [Chloroflexi bacterium]|nr:MAG: MBL fold metallo-hydrolase [Chloroflexota bacterium]
MFVKFWGTRGSIPAGVSAQEIRHKIRRALEGAAGLNLEDPATLKHYIDRLPFAVQGTAGSNTTCIEVRSGEHILIIDAGSGIRLLGNDLLARGFDRGQRHADVLITHTHWDHIQGWPFFLPALVPGNQFTVHSPYPDLPDRLAQQQNPIFFPVPLSQMMAQIEFNLLRENTWHQIGPFRVQPVRLSHPGINYGYRIDDGQSCLVCASDAEYKRVDPKSTENYVEFFRNADLLIFDAQYNLTEVLDKLNWGHSTPMMGAELAFRANVKRLALFHHDPSSDDEKVWRGKEQAEAYLERRHPGYSGCEILVAHDGLSLEI